MTAGRNRNSPCWCGSGKKLKKCHGDPITFVGPKTAVLPGGAVLNIHSVQASMPVVKMFPLPVNLLELARWAVEQATRLETRRCRTGSGFAGSGRSAFRSSRSNRSHGRSWVVP